MTVSELKEQQDQRHRRKYGDVDFNKRISGIYDTRSPGHLYWQPIRWKGWILRCKDDGDIRILPMTETLDEELDKYRVVFSKKIEDKNTKILKYVDHPVIEDVPLDQAFAFAESYTRQAELDTGMAQPNRRWHGEKATEAQLDYIRKLDAAHEIKPNLTKKRASEIITFYKDLKHERKQKSK